MAVAARTAAKGVDRRARILTAAADELSRHGFAGASLARIATASGLSQAGLLHHFSSKLDLLAAVLEQRERADTSSVLDDGVPADLLDVLARMVARNASQPAMVRLFTVIVAEATTPGHPAAPWSAQRFARARDRLAAQVRRGVDDGVFAADTDPMSVAIRCLAMMDGLQLQWLHASDVIDMPGVFADFLAGLARELSP